MANFSLFYAKTMPPIPSGPEKISMVVHAVADSKKHTEGKEIVYRSTMPIFTVPTYGRSLIKKLDDAWMDFDYTAPNLSSAFYEAMKNADGVFGGFSQSTVSHREESALVLSENNKDSVGCYIKNFSYRPQHDPHLHFLAFQLYRYSVGGKNYDVFYGGILKSAQSGNAFIRNGVFVADSLEDPTPREVQIKMEQYENLHGSLVTKKVNCRYPVSFGNYDDHIEYKGGEFSKFPKIELLPLLSPLLLVCQHINRHLPSRCRDMATLLTAMSVSPHATSKVDPTLNSIMEKLWGKPAEANISSFRILGACQDVMPRNRVDWARVLWILDRKKLSQIMEDRFEGRMPCESDVPFDGAIDAIDDALACGVGLLFCSTLSEKKSLTPKKSKRKAAPVASPSLPSTKKAKTAEADANRAIKPEWASFSSDWSGPKGTIFWANGETTKDFSLPAKSNEQLDFLQHILSEGGLIELFSIPNCEGGEPHLFYGDEEGRNKKKPLNDNEDLAGLYCFHEIVGTVFKFDTNADAFN